ncbi:concanavalin A-like lectin/glucanase domain-containing protein [Massariosphaeria phaeospora]|uniref:chitinase n=1 Tax=Massariosphaeria phaeospora TaxID=100035 RepID=A0A7C8IEW4_9PLEO|nr:concanavalin A-like lectin/glucanase domain-containing protein [Massariosphaeria phaeospora]
MRSAVRAFAALASAALLAAPSVAQTYSTCNPTLRSDCPPDSALGRSVKIDLTSASDSFTEQGVVSYDSNGGASFTVAKAGDSPQLISKWYIMFGKVEASIKAAPGAGIVSSFVLLSDTLDEIDWEWLGASSEEVQSNYFGKGLTDTFNRGAFHADPGNQATFKMYTIEWTKDQIVWQIDGKTVRMLKPSDAGNQYPQTPMRVRMGAWSAGDAANPPGTIEWARGPTDYSKGPFTMQVKSVTVSDYSTGTQYTYGDQTGTWGSIKAIGGTINSGGSPIVEEAPAITSSVNGQPIPFSPNGDSATRTGYPWVADASTLASQPQPTYANYPGLPSGWTVSDSGRVVPPSSAPVIDIPSRFVYAIVCAFTFGFLRRI